MSAITSIDAAQQGVFAAEPVTLSADDTITVNSSKKQLALFKNPTGGALTVTIDGAGGTSVAVPGLGSVSVASGLPIALAAGQSKAVVLSTIREYCKGAVHLTGGAGITLQLFDL